ncbi:putative importin subunit beta-4 [Diplonema papillatum]|nr:putative importin subunit beta-4 [Diplonema papillatum]
MSPEEFERVLGTCGSINNEERKAAEAFVMQVIKKKECVALLVAQLENSQHAGVRQLASILLRKKILGHWRNVDVDLKQRVKATLLACAMKETVRVVRLGVTHCIAMLAKTELASGTWPELFQFIEQRSQDADPAQRELPILLLHACSETIAAQLGTQSGQLSHFLMRGLKDSEHHIRVVTLKAANALLAEIELEPTLIATLLPAMVDVLRQSLQSEDEGLFITAFELLDDLLDIPKFKGRDEAMTQIVDFCLPIANGSVQTRALYREKACEILAKLCASRPNFVIKKKLVEPLLQACMKLLGDPTSATAGFQDDDDVQVLSPVALGSTLLDAIACGLPSAVVGELMLGWIKHELVDKKVADPQTKKASVLALGAMSVGCRDLLRENIEFVIGVARTCASDSNPAIREAALEASSHFTDYLQPEILQHHDALLPLGIELLSDASPSVRERAAYMVDTFAENLKDDVLPYAPALMNKLAAIAVTDVGPDGTKSRCVAVSAISSIAEALREKFAPYATDTFNLLLPLVRSEDDDKLTLRACATDAIGICANAVGAAAFRPYLQEVMQLVARGISSDLSCEIREFSFGFWSNMAEIYPGEMASAFPQVIPILYKEIEAKESEVVSNSPFAQLPKVAIPTTGTESDEDSDEDDDDDDGRMRVDHAVVLARASALHCLGIFAKTGGPAFEPYVIESAARGVALVSHHDTTVRKNCLELLTHCGLWVHGSHFVEKQIGYPSEDTLHSATREALNQTLTYMLTIIRADDEKEVVAVACDCIGEICEKIGAVAVHNHVDAIIGELKKLLTEATPCQIVMKDDEDDDDIEEDHDQLLIDGVFDLIDKMAKAYGPGFRQLFDELLPFMLRFADPKRPPTDQLMVVATFAECSDAMGDKIAGHENTMVDLALRGIRSKEAGLRRNSCFALGTICLAVGAALVRDKFGAILQALGRIVANPKEGGDTVDNAVSAVCRLIKTDAAACFLSQTVPGLLPHIPLKSDFSENENVYSTIKLLLQQHAGAVAPFLPQIVYSLVKAAGHEQTQANVKMEISMMLQNLSKTPAAVEAMKALPEDLLAVVRANVIL